MDYRQKVTALYLLVVDLINMFITSAAYPGIGHTLGASVSQLGWISAAYIIGLTIVIPASAPLAAYYGSKNVFVASLLTFLFASIGALIAWRGLQGLGGGLPLPLGQSMACLLYRPAERPALSSVVMLVGLATLYLQELLGMTASGAGSLMLPWAIASLGAIALTGKSYRRLGPQPLFIAGALLQAIHHVSTNNQGAMPVFHLCFALAAALVVMPAALCSRLDNRAVLHHLESTT